MFLVIFPMLLIFHLISLAKHTHLLQTPFFTQFSPHLEYCLLCEDSERKVIPHSKQGPLQLSSQQQSDLSPYLLFHTARQAGMPKAKVTDKNLLVSIKIFQ